MTLANILSEMFPPDARLEELKGRNEFGLMTTTAHEHCVLPVVTKIKDPFSQYKLEKSEWRPIVITLVSAKGWSPESK